MDWTTTGLCSESLLLSPHYQYSRSPSVEKRSTVPAVAVAAAAWLASVQSVQRRVEKR